MAINIFIFKPLFEYGNIISLSTILLWMNLSQRLVPYQPVTVCIVSKHADIIHSNEVNPALLLLV